MEMFIPLIKNCVTYLVPVAALVVSFISLRRSNKISKLEEKIKQYEVDKIEAEKSKIPEAEISAHIAKIGMNKYKLKIWNSGDATAYNVNCDIPAEYGIVMLKDKVPYEYLEPKDSFEENVVISYGSSSKFRIITYWEDEQGVEHSRELLSSI